MISDILVLVINGLSTLLQNSEIPSIPVSTYNKIANFLYSLFDNASFLNLVLDVDLLKILFPIAMGIIGFRYTYFFVMWIIKKIPFLAMK